MKLAKVNPIQTKYYFNPGGNNVPILTRASASSDKGYQTMGLPGASQPYPGGGANKTSLGPYRMGDQEGNSPASALYPGEIFSPLQDPIIRETAVLFPATGNNVFQPDSRDASTLALSSKFAFNQQKAVDNEPFAEYLAGQRLSRDIQDAERNAGLQDLQQTRAIIRHAVDMRREQTNNDYLRRLLDAGLTAQDAKNEMDNVKRANALQEARKVDDREYQSKLLISNLFKGRGLVSRVNEPLSASEAINNPQPSAATALAMGNPGQGFGDSPLDTNRVFMTPDFYKKMLKKTTMTEEYAQDMAAKANLFAQADNEDSEFSRMIEQATKNNTDMTGGSHNTQGAISFNTLDTMKKQDDIEKRKETIMSRIENIRLRGERRSIPLPSILFAKPVVSQFYSEGRVGAKASTTPVLVQTMNPAQLLLSINTNLVSKGNNGETARKLIGLIQKNMNLIGTQENRPLDTITHALRNIALDMNDGQQNQRLPFPNRTVYISNDEIQKALMAFTSESDSVGAVERAFSSYATNLASLDEAFAGGSSTQSLPATINTQSLPATINTRSTVGTVQQEAESRGYSMRPVSSRRLVSGQTAVPSPAGDSGPSLLVSEPTIQSRNLAASRQSVPLYELYSEGQGALPTLSSSSVRRTGQLLLTDATSALSNAFSKRRLILNPLASLPMPSSLLLEPHIDFKGVSPYKASLASELLDQKYKYAIIPYSPPRTSSQSMTPPPPRSGKNSSMPKWQEWATQNGVPYTTLKDMREKYAE
jgi:hypothetical protein